MRSNSREMAEDLGHHLAGEDREEPRLLGVDSLSRGGRAAIVNSDIEAVLALFLELFDWAMFNSLRKVSKPRTRSSRALTRAPEKMPLSCFRLVVAIDRLRRRCGAFHVEEQQVGEEIGELADFFDDENGEERWRGDGSPGRRDCTQRPRETRHAR